MTEFLPDRAACECNHDVIIQQLREEHDQALSKLTQQSNIFKTKLMDTVKQLYEKTHLCDQWKQRGEIAEERAAAFQTQITSIKQEFASNQDQVNSLQTQNKEAASQITQLQSDINKLEEAKEQLEAQITVSVPLLTQANQTRNELKAKTQQYGELTQNLAKTEQELSKHQTMLASCLQGLEQLRRDKGALTSAVASKELERLAMEKHSTEIQSKIEEELVQAQEISKRKQVRIEELETKTRVVSQVMKDLSEARADAARYRVESEHTRETLERERLMAIETNRNANQAREEVNVSRVQLEKLIEQVNRLETEKQDLVSREGNEANGRYE